MAFNHPKVPCSGCGRGFTKTALGPTGVCVRCQDELNALRSTHHAARSTDHATERLEAKLRATADARAREAAEKAAAEARAVIQAEIDRRDAVDKELASRALARQSLLHYVERRIGPKYKAGWVHEDIARRIEKFVRQVEEAAATGSGGPRLILQLPPRSGKSELASDSGPAWILGHHADWSVMITSYSDELPTDWSRSIRDQLKSEEFRTLFPDGATVSKYDASAKAWSTEQGGGVRAAGAGGSILGFGAHVAVVDDPLKGPEEADNPTTLSKLWDWATSTLYSRLAPGGGILLIMQRWSEEDLVGRFVARMEYDEKEIAELRETAAGLRAKERPSAEDLSEAARYEEEAAELEESMDRWEIISYPALAIEDEYLTEDGDIVAVTKDEEPKPEWRPLRKRGEALHPERYGRNYYLKLKRNNPRRFAAMYQQSPVIDDGDYFSRGDFQRYRRTERPELQFLNVFTTWDLAIGTQQFNDHTVGLAGGMDHEGRLWLFERVRGKFGDLDKIADMVLDMHLRWHSSQTGVERTHLEMALSPILKRKMRERGVVINLAEGKDALKPISDKRVRARQLQALAKAGLVMVPEGPDWDNFIDWLVKFGATKVDDDVDAAAWMAIMAERVGLPNDPRAPRPDDDDENWYEKFLEDYELHGARGPMDSSFMGS